VARNDYEKICNHIVRLLRDAREKKGITMYAAAQLSGLSHQMIAYVENGKRRPSLETTVRMAAAIEVDFGEIVKAACKAASGER
jgi:transcriptional regulator with XRE-family HTH domain